MLSEISQSQKDKYCKIAPVRGYLHSQIYRIKGAGVVARVGGGRNGELLINRHKVSLKQDE